MSTLLAFYCYQVPAIPVPLPWNTTVPGLHLLFRLTPSFSTVSDLLSLVEIPACGMKTCSTSLLWPPKSLAMIFAINLRAEMCFPAYAYVLSVVFSLFAPLSTQFCSLYILNILIGYFYIFTLYPYICYLLCCLCRTKFHFFVFVSPFDEKKRFCKKEN